MARRSVPSLTGASVVVLLPALGQPAPRPADLRTGVQSSSPVGVYFRRARRPSWSATQPAAPSSSTRRPGRTTWSGWCWWARSPIRPPNPGRGCYVNGRVRPPTKGLPKRPAWPSQYRRTGPMSMLRGMNAVRRFRTDLAVQSLTLPVEIVRGRKDRIATQDWCSELMRAANGRLTTVEGGRPHGPADPPRRPSSPRWTGSGPPPGDGDKLRRRDGICVTPCPQGGHCGSTGFSALGHGRSIGVGPAGPIPGPAGPKALSARVTKYLLRWSTPWAAGSCQ